MGTTKNIYNVVLLVFVCLFNLSCKGAEKNVTVDKDTNVLARSEESFTINTAKTFYQTKVVATGKKAVKGKKILLLLNDPTIGQNPDGVYEVYVCPEKCDVNLLSSSHLGFVNVLDLYALTVNEPPNYLLIDITRKTTEWVKDNQLFPSLYFTILFRGNKLPQNTESKQAGQMIVAGITVVQKK